MPSRDRNKLHPEVKRRLLLLEAKAEERGIPFFVTQTDRTNLEQAAFWAQGREPLVLVNAKREMASLPRITEKQNEDTITDVKTSVHQFGFGFDIALKGPDGKGVSWDTKADINKAGGPDYDELGKLGEEVGLDWGGRFGSRDLVHFQWTDGLTLKELKAGKRPQENMEPLKKNV